MTIDMTWGQIIRVLLLAAVLIIAAPILFNLGQSATAQSERAQCAISLQARLLGEGLTGGIYNPFEVNCARRSIQFDGEEARILSHDRFNPVTKTTPYTYDVARFTQRQGVEVRVPQEKRLRADSDNLSKDILDALAYEATSCWQLFAQGQADLLDGEQWIGQVNSCVVCAEMTLNLPEDNQPFEESINLEEHLRNTAPHLPSSATRAGSVHDYLYTLEEPSVSARCGAYDWNNQELTLRDQETYVVGFFRAGSKAGWAASRLGFQRTCQAIVITTAERFATECTGVLN